MSPVDDTACLPWEGGPGSFSSEPPVPKIYESMFRLRVGSDGGVFGLDAIQEGVRTKAYVSKNPTKVLGGPIRGGGGDLGVNGGRLGGWSLASN